MNNKYFEIDDEGKKLFITQTALRTNLLAAVVEKDLWVTIVLQLVFKMPFADRIIFKGGSSLSKIWDLIGRMSEDIDLAYDSNFGIFEGDEPTVKQIKKLRKQSSLFVQNEFCETLKTTIADAGLDEWCTVQAQPNGTGNETYPEPRQLYISYKSLFKDEFTDTSSTYIKPIVMLEVSSRSLIEPTGKAKVKSMIAKEFADIDTDIADSEIRTALPEKTFLEKVFLLHEIFVTGRCQRAERKSRHLYACERRVFWKSRIR
ncbi:MAG: nucleotidyl transferase AbiEii/AbiGii toxin family protein [Clostridia bacterium]|nr:nucleotidyl transferase AbiEii/AbiGii toxin family protein [Clostridia bacterium]